jgi:signal transduction histidine kinase
MIDVEMFLKLWPIFLAIILAVAWFIRLEAKVMSSEERRKAEIEYLKAKQIELNLDHIKLEEKMWLRFDAIHTMFSEISTKLTRVETIIDERTNKDGHL